MFLNKRGAGPRLRTGGRVHTGSLPPFQLRKLLPPRKGSGSARKGGRAAPFSLSNCLHGRIIVYTKEAEHREEEEVGGQTLSALGFKRCEKDVERFFDTAIVRTPHPSLPTKRSSLSFSRHFEPE